MPYAVIYMKAGRSESQKRDLVKAVTDAFTSTIGAPAQAVHVLINDLPEENIGHGGILFKDELRK
ncbi:MAG: tautomerase family protein [Deltaproteobacteria bacterium]|nr:tautomerase family protein [Deltaproteobacteria bacterium]